MTRLRQMRSDLTSPRMLPALAVGCLMAAIIIIHCLALAAILFTGPLLPFAVQGTGMMLFGAIAFCLLIGTASSYSGMLAYPQEIPATVLGSLGTTILAGTAGVEGEAAFMTMVALLLVAGVLTGLFLGAVGYFRVGSLFRFIPYPVAGGFFAGTGCVLVLASLSVMSGATVDWLTLPELIGPGMEWTWVPGAVYGLVLVLAMRRGAGFVPLVGSVVLVSLLYHLGLAIADISLAEAKARGLLLSGLSGGGALWPAFAVGDLLQVDWALVLAHVPDLLVATLVTLLCLLIYVNGLEVATGVEVDLDREFRVAGIAGLVAGAGGSVPGCHSFVLTLPCRRLGVETPWIGLIVAVMLALSLFYGTGLLELLPMAVIGGVLFYIGGDLVHDWVIRSRTSLPWTEYGVILLICVVIAVFGFIEGVGVGMLATLALFAFRLSRVSVVAEQFTVRERSSKRTRSIPERAILHQRGDWLQAYRLRGYIFFGSAHRLVDRLKAPLRDKSPPACILLDFSAVSGCDYSGFNLLRQFARLAAETGTRVLVCTSSRQLEANLRRHVAEDDHDDDLFRFEPDLDHALETGENEILARAARLRSPEGAKSLLHGRVGREVEKYLDEQIRFEELLVELDPWLQPREFAPGDRITRHGKAPDGAHFIVSGRAAVYDDEGSRLHESVPGSTLEPWAAFSEHTATGTAVAQTRCHTMLLEPTRRELLEQDDQNLALRLFSFLIHTRNKPGGLQL